MKKLMIVVVVLAVLAVGTTAALAAGEVQTPAEIVSDLTGQPLDDVTDAREAGETYGAQAADAGKLDEFKKARLEQYKLALDEAVKEGRITQAQADELYAAMEARMEACTGDGIGAGCGLGNGAGGGLGRGNGAGQGLGFGRMGGGCGRFPAAS